MSDRNKHQEDHNQNKHFEEPVDQLEETENLTFCDESFAIDENTSTSTSVQVLIYCYSYDTILIRLVMCMLDPRAPNNYLDC